MIVSAGKPIPLVSLVLLALVLLGGTSSELSQLRQWGAYHPLPGFHPAPWQLIRPLFLHFGWVHLICNGLAMLSLAPLLEKRSGPRCLAFVFLTSGAASLWPARYTAVGCSGAVYGLSVALLLEALFEKRDERWKLATMVGAGWLLGLTLPADHLGHALGLMVGALSYLAWRGGRWTVLLLTLVWLGICAWVSRPPNIHAAGFAALRQDYPLHVQPGFHS